MLYSKTQEIIRSEVERVSGLGAYVRVRWDDQTKNVGAPVEVILETVRNVEVQGEPRDRADGAQPGDSAGRVWHMQRAYNILCRVESTWQPNGSPLSVGAPLLKSPQEILERITTRLRSQESRDALLELQAAYLGAGGITKASFPREGHQIACAVCELLFTAAGDDAEAAENLGVIESVELTSELRDAEGLLSEQLEDEKVPADEED